MLDDNTKYRFYEILQDLKKDVDDFAQYWEENHKQDPESFPLKLEPGEFFEQFIIFLSLQWSNEQ